ncbi:MAG: type II toxin-antitoxin system HicB family antitoxin [Dehalococcoidia bacterium]|nr:type II toxin-antitoxin system HicB family antitoxin [Dehalococcoidia bacterium]
MTREFTAIIEKRGKWFVGYIEEIPGVNTQGKTVKETRSNLQEALNLILQANRELAISGPPPERVIRESIYVEV